MKFQAPFHPQEDWQQWERNCWKITLGNYMWDQLQKAEAQKHFTLLLKNVVPYTAASLLSSIPEMPNSEKVTFMSLYSTYLQTSSWDVSLMDLSWRGCHRQQFRVLTEKEYPGGEANKGHNLVLTLFGSLQMVQISFTSIIDIWSLWPLVLNLGRHCNCLKRIWRKWFCTSLLA